MACTGNNQQFLVVSFQFAESLPGSRKRIGLFPMYDKHGGTDFVCMVEQGECEERQVCYLLPTSVGVHRTGMEAARSLVIVPVILHKPGRIVGQICRYAAAAFVSPSGKKIGGALFVELPAHFIPLLLVVRVECSHRG